MSYLMNRSSYVEQLPWKEDANSAPVYLRRNMTVHGRGFDSVLRRCRRSERSVLQAWWTGVEYWHEPEQKTSQLI